jgi:hypothetical protein
MYWDSCVYSDCSGSSIQVMLIHRLKRWLPIRVCKIGSSHRLWLCFFTKYCNKCFWQLSLHSCADASGGTFAGSYHRVRLKEEPSWLPLTLIRYLVMMFRNRSLYHYILLWRPLLLWDLAIFIPNHLLRESLESCFKLLVCFSSVILCKSSSRLPNKLMRSWDKEIGLVSYRTGSFYSQDLLTISLSLNHCVSK